MVTHGKPSMQLRQVRPEDAELLPAFFEGLSEQSLYRRFSSPMRRLTPRMIEQLTRPDPSLAACIVAVENRPGEGPRMVGLAELYGRRGAAQAEGGLVVADSHQGLGLGTALIDGLARAARNRDIATIWGLVQDDNQAMLSLARKRGYPMVDGDLGYEVRVAVPRFG